MIKQLNLLTLYLSEIGILSGPSTDRINDGNSSIYSKKDLPLQQKWHQNLRCIPSNVIQKHFAWNEYLTELKCGGAGLKVKVEFLLFTWTNCILQDQAFCGDWHLSILSKACNGHLWEKTCMDLKRGMGKIVANKANYNLPVLGLKPTFLRNGVSFVWISSYLKDVQEAVKC